MNVQVESVAPKIKDADKVMWGGRLRREKNLGKAIGFLRGCVWWGDKKVNGSVRGRGMRGEKVGKVG